MSNYSLQVMFSRSTH